MTKSSNCFSEGYDDPQSYNQSENLKDLNNRESLTEVKESILDFDFSIISDALRQRNTQIQIISKLQNLKRFINTPLHNI